MQCDALLAGLKLHAFYAGVSRSTFMSQSIDAFLQAAYKNSRRHFTSPVWANLLATIHPLRSRRQGIKAWSQRPKMQRGNFF
jgi:hypothetical protein